MKTKLPYAIATAGAALLLAAPPAAAVHEGSVYAADLGELNGSGGSGSATVTVSDDGETISVQLDADGLNLDGPHAMHIHGIVEGEEVSASSCPTSSADANGDGIIDVAEGAPSYGGVQISLTTSGDTSPDSGLAVDRYPGGTSIAFDRDGIDIPDVLKPNLGKLHIVVHGIDEDGNGELTADQEERSTLDDTLPREATAPALCGTLTAQASGAVQTGAGGTATDAGDQQGLLLGVAAMGSIGLAGLAYRSRRQTV